MTDRVLIPFGNRLLCLSREAFEAALREGPAVAGTIFEAEDAAAAARPQEAVGSCLLSAKAAAVVLSVEPQWLLRQARERRIPHLRVGRYVRFDPAAIAEYCARRPQPTATAISATFPPPTVRRTTGRGGGL